MRKLRVVFVAGFTPIGGKGWGGQTSQATNLIASGIEEAIDFLKVDSSMRSVPPPSWIIRIVDAFRRIVWFVGKLPRADVALVFFSDGASLLEKGLMVLLARLMRKGVVARFGSGNLPEQCSRHGMLRILLQHTIRLSDVVICQSEGWQGYYIRYAEASTQVVVIPNGVRKPMRSWTRQQASKKNIVYVGWMIKAKGIFDLIAAAGMIAADHPELTLTLVGGGMNPATIADHVAACGLSGKVHFPGWVAHDKIEDVIAAGSVFVLPSYVEGLPNALLEAMVLGIPVIASRVGAISEVVEDGKSGLLIEPGDIPGLAKRLDLLLTNEDYACKLGSEGRKVVLEKHSMARVSLLWARALADVAARRGKSEPSAIVISWLHSSMELSKQNRESI